MLTNSEIFILETNENSAKIIESYLKDANLDYDIKVFTDYSLALNSIKENSYNSIIIANCDEYNKHKNVLNELKKYSSKIIATSIDYSTDNIVRAMRLGAKEFLPKPIIKNDLLRIIRSILERKESENTKNSKIVSIFSNKGGIGKTTIATNLAMEISKVTREKVALVDLNLQLGDLSTFLNLNPSFDINYVISKLLDKDEQIISQAFEQYKESNLYVLSAPHYIEQAESITPQKIESLFKSLKKVFQYIIIDLSSNIDANTLKILDKSDLVLFTTIVNIPAIRNCQKCLNIFNSRNYPKGKVKVLINRYMENDEIKIEDIESTIGEKIYWKIPNNYFSIMEAINRGVTVSELNMNSNIADSFRTLATKISDEFVEEVLINYRK